jgi:uncharacterized protein YidB (DUF937 family)
MDDGGSPINGGFMRFGTTRAWGIASGAAVVVAFAGYSVGSQADDGVATGKGSSSGQNVKFAGRGHGGPMLQDLAGRLGVDRQKLEDALADIRAQQQPPATDPRERLAAGLADKLGIDQVKVEKALAAQRPERRERGRGKRADKTAALAKVKPGAGGQGHGVHVRGGPPAAGLAKALGVDEAKLQAALEALKKEQEPAREKRRDEFAQQLADRLGIDVDKVKAALPDPGVPSWKGRP